MPQRIKLRCLGATLAPYTSNNIAIPQFPNNAISQDFSFFVEQLQRGYNTSAADRANFPFALSSVSVKFVDANHFRTQTYYITIDQDTLNSNCG